MKRNREEGLGLLAHGSHPLFGSKVVTAKVNRLERGDGDGGCMAGIDKTPHFFALIITSQFLSIQIHLLDRDGERRANKHITSPPFACDSEQFSLCSLGLSVSTT